MLIPTPSVFLAPALLVLGTITTQLLWLDWRSQLLIRRTATATGDLAAASSPSTSAISNTAIQLPAISPASAVRIADDVEIIGVHVGGKYRAYLLQAFFEKPELHVVNDLLGGFPVSIAYCELNDCTRVVTSETRHQPLDLPFVRTTWRSWRQKHAESDVYLGPFTEAEFIEHRVPRTTRDRIN